MTQIVSFSQAWDDSEVILAGAQGNGSPATESAQPSTQWSNVNGGDGGYNQIDATNEYNWFVSNPPDSVSGVNIFNCSLGISCDSGDFESNQVVSSSTVGGDTGGYYPPFILDPQSSEEMIVGTCRVWRGPSAGGTFSLLSPNFETGGGAICSGEETNLVRAVAAGGALDQSGFSNVIYSGTDGSGPLIPTSPTGGHLWVSTNVSGGTPTWVDRTGSINPSNFPVSSIALDTSDPAGLTAYAGIMGFNVSHIWQTSNAGASWMDFTGNLPDAPLNAIVVDPGVTTSTGTIYVGTDVGVFYSSTASPSWAELGPVPTGGPSQTPGYLPDVPVTALGIFNSGNTKLLRASTYGRGVWQYPLLTTPDFAFSLSDASATIFGGQSASFAGELISLYGYNSQVGLNCVNGITAPPSTCTIVPALVNPTPTGADAGFSVTASGSDGDYIFNLQGSDSQGLTHDFGLTLHVVDFNLTAPSSSNLIVSDLFTSAPVTFQVTAAGSFTGTVNLACSGLPNETSCNFAPSSSTNPTSGSPVTVSLTITTGANAPLGTYPIVITASSPGAPAAKTQSLTLVITTGFSVTSDPDTQSVNPGSTASYALTVTPVGASSFGSEVIYTCSGLPPLALCAFAPASPISAGAGTTTVNLKITTTSAVSPSLGTPSGTYSVIINFSSAGLNQSFPLTLIVNSPTQSKFDFSISNNSGAQTVSPGGTANFSLQLVPVTSSIFGQTVTLACSGAPALSTCMFNPPEVGQGSGATAVVFSVVTTPATSSLIRRRFTPRDSERKNFAFAWAIAFPFGLLLDLRRKRALSLLALTLCFCAILFACGGGLSGNTIATTPQPGTTSGTYPITITATTGSVTHTASALLNVQ